MNKDNQRAWDMFNISNGKQLWTSCDLCKTFCLGLVAGLFITFIVVSIIS
jgi:hypothetical protein